MEGSGQLHALTALPPGKAAPGTHWLGGWLDPRAGLDAVVNAVIYICIYLSSERR